MLSLSVKMSGVSQLTANEMKRVAITHCSHYRQQVDQASML